MTFPNHHIEIETKNKNQQTKETQKVVLYFTKKKIRKLQEQVPTIKETKHPFQS